MDRNLHYVRVTGMLHPFFPSPEHGRVKSASYEARPGGTFTYSTPEGKKLTREIREGGNTTLLLPANSISFVQIESTIRLPEYIALRFNLRITHVHRGLLLGTGPLVDPRFEGNLLIPLHNLTDQDYEISQDEGLIWIEFTKTSHRMPALLPDKGTDHGETIATIEAHKKNRGTEYYFEKANHNNPIRSSIGGVIADLQKTAISAERSAKRAERASKLFLTIGFLGVAALVATTAVALHQYFGQIGALAQGVQDKASTALGKVDQAVSGAEGARREADDARKDVQMLRSELNEIKSALQLLQGQTPQQQQSQPPQRRGR